MSQADLQIRNHAHVGREPNAADGEEGALHHRGQLPHTTCFSGALIIPFPSYTRTPAGQPPPGRVSGCWSGSMGTRGSGQGADS